MNKAKRLSNHFVQDSNKEIIAYLGKNVKEYAEKSQEILSKLELRCENHPAVVLSRHGTYRRRIKETGEELAIQRMLCSKCRMTISVLPDFLLPRKHYSADEIETVIMQSETTKIYDIETEASTYSVRRWLREMKVLMVGWLSRLKILAKERFAVWSSEITLREMSLIEQIQYLSRRLPQIESSGNSLSYACMYAGLHPAPHSLVN